MILKYQKVTDNFTTHTIIEPDYKEGDTKCTELCTIGLDTYVYYPDSLELPEQRFDIDVSIESVTLTDDLKEEIKALCPHVQLSYKRLQERIRSRYTIEDEQYFTRISIGKLNGTYEYRQGEAELIAAYQFWVEECREIARLERANIGL